VRGESGDSSLHLCVPENAVGKSEIAVLLEHGTPYITLEIEGKWQLLIVYRALTYRYSSREYHEEI